MKNAVIVPVGAKGGFVVRTAAPGRAEVEACYRTFISGLLDVTDNLVTGRQRDGAAARRRAPRRRRLLPRRRGRQGHREVLRHRQRGRRVLRVLARRRVRLRRLGRLRPQGDGDHREGRVGERQAALPRAGRRHPDARSSPSSASATCPATCSATACCSPAHIRLLAAFDHRHVFVDPDPGRRERASPSGERMFALPRSSWDDYDRDVDQRGRWGVAAHGEVGAGRPGDARRARDRRGRHAR